MSSQYLLYKVPAKYGKMARKIYVINHEHTHEHVLVNGDRYRRNSMSLLNEHLSINQLINIHDVHQLYMLNSQIII